MSENNGQKNRRTSIKFCRKKIGSFYGERNNPLIPKMPSGKGHNTVPVSDLLALFDSKRNTSKNTNENQNSSGTGGKNK